MAAIIATQSFSEAGGTDVFPNLALAGAIRMDISKYPEYREERPDGTIVTVVAEWWFQEWEEAFEVFGNRAEQLGYDYVFGTQIVEYDHAAVLTGDGYRFVPEAPQVGDASAEH